MIDQKLSTARAIHASPYAFEVMAGMTSACGDMVSVMLLLLVRMDREGAVRIDMSTLPDFLRLEQERVDRAVSGLVRHGWVISIDDHALRNGILDCLVNGAFIYSDSDTLVGAVAAKRK
ncbi:MULTISPECIES: hypothetical protein [Pseudomonas]|uniref:MarR family transcriptional regulator n=1 Tax=Pseudomonas quercus TaxID=2722792 RepID=A0ABX0Y9F6_9PSED|nr:MULTISPECIES: hypothetical protein [Pseudomonas]MBF7141431.1 hypothetical protein [Pseudomonas sp. LY10J]NJO99969.1 hypothetical protein [Pseudomonas quercus]